MDLNFGLPGGKRLHARERSKQQSAFGGASTREQATCLRSGGQDSLQKPYHNDELLTLIAQRLGRPPDAIRISNRWKNQSAPNEVNPELAIRLEGNARPNSATPGVAFPVLTSSVRLPPPGGADFGEDAVAHASRKERAQR